MKKVFVILSFSALIFLAGCATKVVESDSDWLVNEVVELKDLSIIEVAEPDEGEVKVIAPEVIETKVKKEPEEGIVEIVDAEEVLTEEPINPAEFIDYNAPFVSQAPYAYWDEMHNEACEEASMIMTDAWFNHKELNAHLMEQGIIKLVRWQEENNYTVDLTANETVEILDKYFNLNSKIITDVSADSIKNELLAKRLIIVPVAGRLLGNPYYKRPGPLYHMLVVRGFDDKKKEFITNDPGTKRGEAYCYKYNTLISAIHDWPKQGKTKEDVSEAEMNAGRQVIISVWQQET